MFISGCANAQSTTTTAELKISGESLPAIRHVTDMKVSGDTLLFVFECEDGYGQRLLRRAIIDSTNNTIKISPDMGKREDGYYTSYMPYPFISDNGALRVVGQDDCEIFTVENDTAFVRTRQYLMDSNSTVPFPLSQYVQDVFMTARDKYVFIGREPKGGRQYALKADLYSAKIDTIRRISISSEFQSWMVNAGELAYSDRHKRLAFAYRLHPVIELFDTDGKIISSVRLSEDTFDPTTLEKADFEDLNPLNIVDITATDDYIYALYWGHKHGDTGNSKIYQLDWTGNVIAQNILDYSVYKIAFVDCNTLVCWTGNGFVLIGAD